MNDTNLAVKDDIAEVSTVEEKGKVLEITGENKNMQTKKIGIFYYIVKKIIDILFGIIGTIMLIPISVVIFIMKIIKKENDGPMIYTQLRIGKNGKEFKLYKFRTMVMNADEKLEIYLNENEEAKKEYEKYHKLKEDPRITKIGNFLRKTSLDEFPQFINVLKGDMSVVGPRPYLHKELKDMGEYYNEIIKAKPGITGYWQVNGRNDVDFSDRTYMDTYYIERRGIIMDLKIIIKTILKIFKKEGAM